MNMLKTTPFHSRTSLLCEGSNWRRWAGYTVASSYELLHDREYFAIRNSAALIDVTPLFKYRIDGPDAEKLLNRVITRDVRKLKVGQVFYTPWCDEQGKMLDDGTLHRLDEGTYRMTAADPTLRWLSDNAFGLNVNIVDESEEIAGLALQGPTSRDILKQVVTGINLDALKYYRLAHGELAGMPVTISRTGYTGDLGYEIWIRTQDAEAIWDCLIEAGRGYQITPAGILALDIARVEAGLFMVEVDYVSSRHALIEAQKSSPFEMGMEWAVDFNKGNFVGRKALIEESKHRPEWRFVGIEMSWPSLERAYAEHGLPPRLTATAWRTSIPIYVEGLQIGYASSGCWSPLLKKNLALAHLKAEYSTPGTPVDIEITVEHQRRTAQATVVKTPFFDPERKRS
jgi:aminomethyltransferase